MKMKALLLGLFIGCLLGLAWPVRSEKTDPEKHWSESEMDTAWLTFENTDDPRGGDFLVRFVSDQCYKCTPITVFRGNETRKIKISSQFKWTITLEYLDPNSVNPVIWASLYTGFKEYGKYKMHLELKSTEAEMLLVVLSPGSLSILPIIIACSVCLCMSQLLLQLFLVRINTTHGRKVENTNFQTFLGILSIVQMDLLHSQKQ